MHTCTPKRSLICKRLKLKIYATKLPQMITIKSFTDVNIRMKLVPEISMGLQRKLHNKTLKVTQ
jgi:hypothetical protein